jgi:hypothetical protein
MYRKLLFIIICINAISCKDSLHQLDCRNFHLGKFITPSSLNQQSVIIRSETTQTEINSKTGGIIRSKINWLGPCIYQLTDAEISLDSSKNFKPFLPRGTMTVKIMKVEKDYCIYEASFTDVSMKMIDTLKIIKE